MKSSEDTTRDEDHVRVLGEEEHREHHSRVLDVEARHDLALALGHVERMAVGLGQARDVVDEEQRKQRNPEPAEEAPVAVLARDDVREVHALPGHERAHEREAHGDLVGDHLRRGAHGADERVLRIRRPAGDDDAVDAHRGHGEHHQDRRVHVGDHPRRA